MTGNLEILMQLRNAKVQKDANIQAAEDIGKKAELGYFDVEFTMYGCAYLDRRTDMMQYRISSKAEDIFDYIEQAAQIDIYPSKVERLTLKCPVPMGVKELIAQDVKKELAKELRKKYSKAFFVELYELADGICSDHAEAILWEEAERIEGVFEEEPLRQLEELVHYTYSCKKIRQEVYQKLLKWIEDEQSNMDEDFVSKDIFEKVLYGIAYTEDGKLKYFSNAQRDHVYQKAYGLEAQGVFVSPLYHKTYWYNYIYRLNHVIKDYKDELKRVYNQAYLEKIAQIKGVANAEKREAFLKKLDEVAEQYGSDSADTMKRYGYRWGVL